MSHISLIDVLQSRSTLTDKGIRFIEGGEQEDFLSYQALYAAAKQVLAYLQQQGIQPKDEVVFQLDDNQTFIIVFWACILGGMIPVPVAIGRNDDHKQKLFNIWPVLNTPWIVVEVKQWEAIEKYAAKTNQLAEVKEIDSRIVPLEEVFSLDQEGEIFPATADDIAFIQFSSGSTGSPKGITLTHRNLITNVEAIAIGGNYQEGDSLISWMPLTHDMGLIGFHLNPLYCGLNQYLIPTHLFVRRPAIWIDKASQYQVTVLCSPNFGFHYVIKHCLGGEARDWNLEAVRLIYNGAEPISEELSEEFLTKMERYGLDPLVMCPVYGLAEATLAVSMSKLTDPVRSINLDRNLLGFGETVEEKPASLQTVSFVNVGTEVTNCQVRIADRERQEVPAGIIGQVEIKGPNVTAGYYNNPTATDAVLTADGWLNTGDLGFMRNGELFITGRDKDIVFVNGQNYYPHDIERIGEEVEGIELNKLAVAGYFNHNKGKDELLGFVFHRGALQKFVPLAEALQRHINQQTGLSLDRLIPVRVIPKTTSGKIQRFKLLKEYQQGKFAAVEEELRQLHQLTAPKETPYVAPENEAETQMQAIWEKVLGRKNLSVVDSFFALGGNSLKAAELGMSLQKELEVELSAQILYEHQSIRALTAQLAQLRPAPYQSIPLAESQAWYEVGAAQRRLYYQWALSPKSTSYNIPTAIELNGPIDADRMQKVFQTLISRHDTLRMRFALRGEPHFQIDATASQDWEVLESNPLKVADLLPTFVQAFDLTQGSLFRTKLVRIKPEKHILFLDFHHIISDGLSVYKLLNEFWYLYAGAAFPVPQVQFKDFVSWEKRQAQTERLQSQEAYWRKELTAPLPVLSLPLDFPRPALFSDQGGRVRLPLTLERIETLRAFAEKQGCTLHALLFAFYHVFLAKYSGQSDLVIGIPVAGRHHPDLQDLQGMFVNNLPLRHTFDDKASFLQQVTEISELIQKALENQEYPFEQTAEWAELNRDVSRNPVFDTMFVYQNMGLPRPQSPALTSGRYFFDPGISKYDLSLEVFDTEDSLELSFEYASSLFRKERIVQMTQHFDMLLERLLQHPTQALGQVTLLTAAEYTRELVNLNATETAVPASRVHQIFALQALQTPDAIALSCGGQQLSYAQLNARAEALKQSLQKEGLASGQVVAIQQDRSLDLMISILAVLKAGACFVPVDPSLPKKRIQFILEDSQAVMLLRDQVEIVQLKPTQPHSMETDLAYMIYTSGTTGKPKGVMIGHASLSNYLNWAAQRYVADEAANFPLFTSISFDLTITALFTPLVTGQTLFIYDQGEQSLLLEQILQDNQVEVIKLTPAHLRLLCQQDRQQFPQSLRVKRLIVGGEQLTTQVAHDTYQWFDESIEILNEYGPTEATVGCIVAAFAPNATDPVVPIGSPIYNTQVYVLDPWLQPVPQGVEGELYLAGQGLALGYLNRPELTAEKFCPNPFVPGTKMYKTGDIVQRIAEGQLRYLGRRDEQVKINGYRIELAEISQQLSAHPEIQDVLITTAEGKNENLFLKAYFIGNQRNGEAPTESSLRQFLTETLPHYMIPARFIAIPQIPLTTNGKVDYKALAEWDAVPAQAIENRKSTDMEKAMIQVWEALLGEEPLRPNDNFYELGGDSIKAVQIAAKLREEGIAVRVEDILTFHTIEQISQRASWTTPQQSYTQEAIAGSLAPWPIISWFQAQDWADASQYHQSILLQLASETDAALLEKAFQHLVRHHDGLRLNLDPATQTLFFNPAHLHQASVWLRESGPQAKEYRSILKKLQQNLSLSDSLLIQGALLQDQTGSERLLLTAHHLLVDGISWRILLQDLQTIYQALAADRPVELPAKTASLLDWQERYAAFAQTQAAIQAQGYWADTLASNFSLPLDQEAINWQFGQQATIARRLDTGKTQYLLTEAPVQYKTDIQLLQLVALCQTLQNWTGQTACLLELENHGRHFEDLDTSRTIGWFTCLHPLKLSLRGETPDQQIKSIKEQLQQIPQQGLSYGIDEQPRMASLAEVRFNYLGQFGQELHNDLFSLSQQFGLSSAPENPLSTKLEINTLVIEGALEVSVSYHQAAFLSTTIQTFMDQFFHHLEQLITYQQQEQTTYLTPSDFEAADLNQEELDALFN